MSAKWPRKLVANCDSTPWGLSRHGTALIPALLSSRSRGRSPQPAANARTESRSSVSSRRISTPAGNNASALATLRTATTTSAPRAASSRAATSPSPLVAPVTTAVRPVWSGMSSKVQFTGMTRLQLSGLPIRSGATVARSG